MIYKIIENDKYKLVISYDEEPQSPDEFDDDDCFVVYDHRDFCVKKEGFAPMEIFMYWKQGAPLYKKHFTFPLYAYIHSGVSLSLSRDKYPFTDQWDVSFKGFVMVKRQGGTWKNLQAYNRGLTKVKEWNEYLNGEYYMYEFFFRDAVSEEWEQEDSCGGFSGEDGLKEIEDQHKQYFEYETVN
jgi:hypothetical protein